MKSVVAQYDVEELITKREEVSKEIKDRLFVKTKQFSLQLDDISIVIKKLIL
jgi:hypothetical protein